jgi:uncharacterized membrane protein
MNLIFIATDSFTTRLIRLLLRDKPAQALLSQNEII